MVKKVNFSLTTIVIVLYGCFSGNCYQQSEFNELQIEGLAREAIVDTLNSYFQFIIMENGERVFISETDKSSFFQDVQFGDSLFKRQGEDTVFLFRNGKKTWYTVDFNCLE